MKDGVRLTQSETEQRAAYKLRYQIYVQTMGRFREKGDHALKELRDEFDDFAHSVVAIKNGAPTGTLRIFWGGDGAFAPSLQTDYRLDSLLRLLNSRHICVVERLMVDEKHRGSTTVLRLYQEVMKFVLAHQVEAVVILCQPHHVNSYLKLGFRPFADKYVYPGVGMVIPMALIAGDYQHLKNIGSPFAKLISPEDTSYCRHVNNLQKLIMGKANITNIIRYTDLLKQRADIVRGSCLHQDKSKAELYNARLKMRLSV
ncbi:MAG: hypothetical protein CVV13_05655 [Gammaproteobacteria bacterium HGW-Gammaproteobacteria-3]|nr:MAG: hypothetical protein CVV13_05655 [Gammaproteobacteria bacterium HGW-Gammaproteobacteria-3]